MGSRSSGWPFGPLEDKGDGEHDGFSGRRFMVDADQVNLGFLNRDAVPHLVGIKSFFLVEGSNYNLFAVWDDDVSPQKHDGVMTAALSKIGQLHDQHQYRLAQEKARTAAKSVFGERASNNALAVNSTVGALGSHGD